LTAEVNEALLGYAYPGNVRELRNIIERAVILTESPRIELRHLPQRVLTLGGKESWAPTRPVEVVPGVDSLVDVEVRMIRQAMRRAGSVRTEAAKLSASVAISSCVACGNRHEGGVREESRQTTHEKSLSL